MYYHFKPGKIYWIVYILLRKLGIAAVGLLLRQNPGFQLAVCLLILFACFYAQVKHQPYMSSSQRDEVVKTHKAKVARYDELSSQGKARPPDLQVHKRISTHIQQLLELKAEGKLTGDQGSRGRLGGAPKSRFKMGGGADVVEEGVDVIPTL